VQIISKKSSKVFKNVQVPFRVYDIKELYALVILIEVTAQYICTVVQFGQNIVLQFY